jgi:hypothetical protein
LNNRKTIYYRKFCSIWFFYFFACDRFSDGKSPVGRPAPVDKKTAIQHKATEKAKANTIQQLIDTTDKEIHEMVYQLYGLTEEERRVVELNFSSASFYETGEDEFKILTHYMDKL